MQKTGFALLVAGWLILALAFAAHVHWDNRVLWLPEIAFFAATVLGFTSIPESENRALSVVIGLAGLGSATVYAVIYVFFFFRVG